MKTLKNLIFLIVFLLVSSTVTFAQSELDSLLKQKLKVKTEIAGLVDTTSLISRNPVSFHISILFKERDYENRISENGRKINKSQKQISEDSLAIVSLKGVIVYPNLKFFFKKTESF